MRRKSLHELRHARRRWLAAWLGAAAIGVANGSVRAATYERWLGERAAHQLSTASLIAAFAAYFRGLERRWPLGSTGNALRVGAAWLVLTVGFEFGFGRAVAKQSWEELTADYKLSEGRGWPLVLVWIALGPAVVRELNER